MIATPNALDTIVLSIIVGALCLFVADRFRFPSILLFLGSGILLGESGLKLISPVTLGRGLDVAVSTIVVLILFEGALSLNTRGLKNTRMSLLLHVVLTTVVTAGTAFAASTFVLGMPVETAAVFSALAIVTGPTVVKPILMHLPLRGRVKAFLDGEAVLTDGIGAIFSVVLLQLFASKAEIGSTVVTFLVGVFAGALVGTTMGILTKTVLVRLSRAGREGSLFILLFAVYLGYFASEKVVAGSGLICVTAFGIVLSTADYHVKHELLLFKSHLTRIAISFLFVLLASQFSFRSLGGILLPGLAVVLILIIVRFPIVLLSTIRASFTLPERLFMAWLGPRGIIALSVASLAALRLRAVGVPGTQTLEVVTLLLISITVLAQGLSARPAARLSGILQHGDGDLLILGINEATLALSRLWKERQQEVLLIDSDPKKTQAAEREGYPCILGNGVDSGTYAGVETEDYDAALSATGNGELNVLFCQMMARSFGIKKTYTFLAQDVSEDLLEVMRHAGVNFAELGRTSNRRGEPVAAVVSFVTRMLGKRPFAVTCGVGDLDRVAANGGRSGGAISVLCVIRGQDLHIYHRQFQLAPTDRLLVITDDRKVAKALVPKL